jgi:hypothetical protein
LRRNCLLKYLIGRNIEGKIEVMGRRGIRGKELLDDLQEKKGYWKSQEGALSGTLWRTRFGKDNTCRTADGRMNE